MRIVIQKVTEAAVAVEVTDEKNGGDMTERREVEYETIAEIKRGYMILAGVEEADGDEDVDWLAQKIIALRIFEDENGVMNKSIMEVGGDIIVVSQFTLFAQTKRGNRPSYMRAAGHEKAIYCYERLIQQLEMRLGRKVQHGKFGAMMKVSLVNDGPTTIIIDTKNLC